MLVAISSVAAAVLYHFVCCVREKKSKISNFSTTRSHKSRAATPNFVRATFCVRKTTQFLYLATLYELHNTKIKSILFVAGAANNDRQFAYQSCKCCIKHRFASERQIANLKASKETRVVLESGNKRDVFFIFNKNCLWYHCKSAF